MNFNRILYSFSLFLLLILYVTAHISKNNSFFGIVFLFGMMAINVAGHEILTRRFMESNAENRKHLRLLMKPTDSNHMENQKPEK